MDPNLLNLDPVAAEIFAPALRAIAPRKPEPWNPPKSALQKAHDRIADLLYVEIDLNNSPDAIGSHMGACPEEIAEPVIRELLERHADELAETCANRYAVWCREQMEG
jgi:hypothetical protein